MKKNRLVKLKEVEGKCEVCGGRAQYIHHIDESKDNHELNNLVVLCGKCHGVVHAGRKNKKCESIGKYKKLYGLSIKEMVEKFGRNKGCYYSWHHNGKLKEYLENPSLMFPVDYVQGSTAPIMKMPIQSKFRKLYGITLKEMGLMIGTNGHKKALRMHYDGILMEYIKKFKSKEQNDTN